MVCSRVFSHVRINVACRDPTKVTFERLIKMKKKLFLIGFTVEGYEQVRNFDRLDDDDDDPGEDDDRQKDDHMDDITDEKLEDGDNAIDELDKSNLVQNHGPFGSSVKKVSARSDYHIANMSDAKHEQFILECVDKIPCANNLFLDQKPIALAPDTNVDYLMEYGEGSRSDNPEYCSELLKSLDVEESDDEKVGVMEHDMDILLT